MSALADALTLDAEATRSPARAGPSSTARHLRHHRPTCYHPGAAELVGAWAATPSFIAGRFGEILAASTLAEAVNPACRLGSNRFREAFLNEDNRARYGDWESYTAVLAAGLRSCVESDVDHVRLGVLVSDLARSQRFRELWARQDASAPSAGTTAFHRRSDHARDQHLRLPGPGRLTLVVYHARPDTYDAQALHRLRNLPKLGREIVDS